MRVLVLGASSIIGRDLAVRFARGNDLLLAGRSMASLMEAAGECRSAGARSVATLTADLAASPAWMTECAAFAPDCVINAACATSRLRDDAIAGETLATVLRADLTSPVELIDVLRRSRPEAKLRVVFVTTLLAVVPSPRREVYGRLKALHELALAFRASRDANVQLLLARICQPIPVSRATSASAAFARATLAAFERGEREIRFGWTGRVVMALHSIHPVLFRAFIWATRHLRGSGAE